MAKFMIDFTQKAEFSVEISDNECLRNSSEIDDVSEIYKVSTNDDASEIDAISTNYILQIVEVSEIEETTNKILENNQFEENILPQNSMTGIIEDLDDFIRSTNIEADLDNVLSEDKNSSVINWNRITNLYRF